MSAEKDKSHHGTHRACGACHPLLLLIKNQPRSQLLGLTLSCGPAKQGRAARGMVAL